MGAGAGRPGGVATEPGGAAAPPGYGDGDGAVVGDLPFSPLFTAAGVGVGAEVRRPSGARWRRTPASSLDGRPPAPGEPWPAAGRPPPTPPLRPTPPATFPSSSAAIRARSAEGGSAQRSPAVAEPGSSPALSAARAAILLMHTEMGGQYPEIASARRQAQLRSGQSRQQKGGAGSAAAAPAPDESGERHSGRSNASVELSRRGPNSPVAVEDAGGAAPVAEATPDSAASSTQLLADVCAAVKIAERGFAALPASAAAGGNPAVDALRAVHGLLRQWDTGNAASAVGPPPPNMLATPQWSGHPAGNSYGFSTSGTGPGWPGDVSMGRNDLPTPRIHSPKPNLGGNRERGIGVAPPVPALCRRTCTVLVVEAALPATGSAEQVMGHFVADVADAVADHGGALLGHQWGGMGRRAVAGWNTPIATSRHAELACRAATACAARVGALCRSGDAVAWGVGVATGDVLWTRPAVPHDTAANGADAAGAQGMSGWAISTAERLAQLCPLLGEGVLVAESSVRRLGGSIATLPVDIIDPLHRGDEPCVVHALLRPGWQDAFRSHATPRHADGKSGAAPATTAAAYTAAFDALQRGDWAETKRQAAAAQRMLPGFFHADRLVRLAEAAGKHGGVVAGVDIATRYSRPYGWIEFETSLNLEPPQWNVTQRSRFSSVQDRWFDKLEAAVTQQADKAEEQRAGTRSPSKVAGVKPLAQRRPIGAFNDVSGRAWSCSDYLLGRGGFGRVLLGMDGLGTPAAVKVISLSRMQLSDAAARTLREVQLLTTLRHENIVTCYGAAALHGRVLLVMELMPAGSLDTIVTEFGRRDRSGTQRGLPPRIVQRYTRDLVAGLAYLHSRGVVHRDLKLANVLLSLDGQCRISDFGLAVLVGEQIAETADAAASAASAKRALPLPAGGDVAKGVMGTTAYLAPEAFVSQEQGKPGDVWALGLCVCACLIAGPPFPTPLHSYAYPEEHAQFPEGFGAGLPPAARGFVARCLVLRPGSRPEVKQLQWHPFIVSTIPDMYPGTGCTSSVAGDSRYGLGTYTESYATLESGTMELVTGAHRSRETRTLTFPVCGMSEGTLPPTPDLGGRGVLQPEYGVAASTSSRGSHTSDPFGAPTSVRAGKDARDELSGSCRRDEMSCSLGARSPSPASGQRATAGEVCYQQQELAHTPTPRAGGRGSAAESAREGAAAAAAAEKMPSASPHPPSASPTSHRPQLGAVAAQHAGRSQT